MVQSTCNATIILLLLWAAAIARAQEVQPSGRGNSATQKVTYVDHVLPIFRSRCGSCHNSSDQSGGLVLDGYSGVMAGGGSGQVVTAGDVASSRLWKAVAHEAEPFMPQGADKLPDAELAVIRAWIQQGLLEKSTSVAKLPKKTEIDRIEVSDQRPAEVAMPAAFIGEPPRVTLRPNAVTALAVSPWAPLAAVSGQEQVGLYSTQTLLPWGFLPFPEGQPQVLKFSRNGALLLVGGGHNAASGRVVVFDVKTGRRMIEVGDEYDTVLAADISSDHTLIALGGPKRLVRVYSAASGELVHEMKKHTDWITAIEFSPDGVLLASADRSSGLCVWETHSGNLFHDLTGHRAAVTGISWRPDSNVLVSASEDGTLKLWGMEEGNQIKSWNVPAGATALEFVRDGRLVSTGRDKRVRLWQQDGSQIREFPPLADIGVEVAFDAETERVLGGDWSGVIHVWDAAKGNEIGQLTTNPRPLDDDIKTVETQLAKLEEAPSPVDAAAERPVESVIQVLRAQLSAMTEAADHTTPTADAKN
jgi:WD40 repeat protein